jgi:hypothetical protein
MCRSRDSIKVKWIDTVQMNGKRTQQRLLKRRKPAVARFVIVVVPNTLCFTCSAIPVLLDDMSSNQMGLGERSSLRGDPPTSFTASVSRQCVAIKPNPQNSGCIYIVVAGPGVQAIDVDYEIGTKQTVSRGR